jgi:hypothetical protein
MHTYRSYIRTYVHVYTNTYIHTGFQPFDTSGLTISVLLIAKNDTLRNSILRYLEALELSATSVADLKGATEAFGAHGAFDIVIACPTVEKRAQQVSSCASLCVVCVCVCE